MRGRFGGDPRMARLLPIPGIGPLGAATIIAEVWDVGRFASPERLTCWSGLTPTERSSADHTRRGHISKQGSRWLGWTCIEAATNAVRDPDLGRFAPRIARRRGVRIARVALARRLLTLAHYALRDPQGCSAYPMVPARSVIRMASADGRRLIEPPGPHRHHGTSPELMLGPTHPRSLVPAVYLSEHD